MRCIRLTTVIIIFHQYQTLNTAKDLLVLLNDLGLVFEYLGHCQQTEVLQVLISVLYEQPQLRDAELDGGSVVGNPHDHRGNALVEQ